MRTSTWPRSFPFPEFSYDAELALQQANDEYRRNSSLLSPSRKLKSTVLESLALKYRFIGIESLK